MNKLRTASSITTTTTRAPVLTARSSMGFHLEGELGRLLKAVVEQWVLPAPVSNPDMLEMFRDPDRQPLREREPWAGEFAGKYLTHAVQLYRLTPTPKLRKHIQWFVKELVSLQAEDGYLGPWPKAWRLRKGAPNSVNDHAPWDAWGHYHIMLGLLLWHEISRDRRALRCVCRIGDLLCNRFLGEKSETLHATDWQEMNLAPIHTLALLFRITGRKRYLELALQIVREFEIPPAGDYIREALAGKEFYLTPKPRWESLHPIMGISELYFITGDEKYRQAFEQIWWSIVKTDRHNTGGFSSGEKAQGSPYHEGVIETCCTVAWMAMSVEMLRMTGNPVVADELELSTLNAGIGQISPSGRWVTYNTPMDGVRMVSTKDINFQTRPGSAELNCCSVNGPRVLGMLSDWAIMAQEGGLALNYYGPGRLQAKLASGNAVILTQETEYPRDGQVSLTLQMDRPECFVLSLRIPAWSRQTSVLVNGEKIENVKPGQYLQLEREWKSGDNIALALDFRLHYWVNETVPPVDGVWRASVYRGPILLTYDPRFNPDGEVPTLMADGLFGTRVEPDTWLRPLLLLEFPVGEGRSLRLCDFGSAGAAGHAYRSWLPVKFSRPPAVEFSRENPWRSKTVIS